MRSARGRVRRRVPSESVTPLAPVLGAGPAPGEARDPRSGRPRSNPFNRLPLHVALNSGTCQGGYLECGRRDVRSGNACPPTSSRPGRPAGRSDDVALALGRSIVSAGRRFSARRVRGPIALAEWARAHVPQAIRATVMAIEDPELTDSSCPARDVVEQMTHLRETVHRGPVAGGGPRCADEDRESTRPPGRRPTRHPHLFVGPAVVDRWVSGRRPTRRPRCRCSHVLSTP